MHSYSKAVRVASRLVKRHHAARLAEVVLGDTGIESVGGQLAPWIALVAVAAAAAARTILRSATAITAQRCTKAKP